jgi:plasmid stabilization system protein ParE
VIALDIEPAAAREITEAVEHYESLRPGLGDRFVQHLDRKFRLLQETPGMAQRINHGCRRAVLHTFPYCVVYRETPFALQVVAVMPTQLDPKRMELRAALSSIRDES